MGKTKTGTKRGKRGTPIFAKGVGVPVGHVIDGEFRKSVRGSVHFLRAPRAIAFDTSTLIDAESAGATLVVVQDTETGNVYRAPLGLVWSKGFVLDRGHNPQTALTLEHWQRNQEVMLQASLLAP